MHREKDTHGERDKTTWRDTHRDMQTERVTHTERDILPQEGTHTPDSEIHTHTLRQRNLNKEINNTLTH